MPYKVSGVSWSRIYKNALYVLNDKGIFSRRNPETGDRSYQSRVAPGASAFTASPWAYNGHVFAMSEEGDTFVIDAGDQYRLVRVNSLDDFSMATPAIVGDRLLIRTPRSVRSGHFASLVPRAVQKKMRACRSGQVSFDVIIEGETMRVMVMVKATKKSEAGVRPGDPGFDKLVEQMGKFNDELVKAGVILAADGLHPSSKGKRVHVSASGEQRTVVDGPFTETKELIAGFWIWQVKSIEEAVDWVMRCPQPMPGEEAQIEIRPIFEAEEFGEEFARGKEERMRAVQQRKQ